MQQNYFSLSTIMKITLACSFNDIENAFDARKRQQWQVLQCFLYRFCLTHSRTFSTCHLSTTLGNLHRQHSVCMADKTVQEEYKQYISKSYSSTLQLGTVIFLLTETESETKNFSEPINWNKKNRFLKEKILQEQQLEHIHSTAKTKITYYRNAIFFINHITLNITTWLSNITIMKPIWFHKQLKWAIFNNRLEQTVVYSRKNRILDWAWFYICTNTI